MVHVARGSEPRLLSFFDLRVVFGRSMVNLYSVAKNQSQSDNTNKAVSATILLAYMDRRPAQHLYAKCMHTGDLGNRAPFKRALRCAELTAAAADESAWRGLAHCAVALAQLALSVCALGFSSLRGRSTEWRPPEESQSSQRRKFAIPVHSAHGRRARAPRHR